MTTTPTPVLEPVPTPDASIKLHLYRLVVRVEVQPNKFDVQNYWVEAPTQCSAAKHTALRDEVDDISLIEKWPGTLPSSASITFTTTQECP